MGTNYYIRRKVDEEKRKELIQLITENDLSNSEKIKYLSEELYGKAEFINSEESLVGCEIHIGKKSRGWKFLWEHHLYEVRHGHIVEKEVNPGHKLIRYVEDPSTLYSLYGDLTKESIRKFVMDDDNELFDECGERCNKEAFLDMAFNSEGLDSKEYEKECPPRRRYVNDDDTMKPLKMAGLKISNKDSDFYSDGLRFSVHHDFC
jgi:hypothetical protein